jgi:hypothetical protein
MDWSEWFPKLLGGAILVFAVIFWAFTDRVEPLFVTTGGTLLAIGQGARALTELKKPVPGVNNVPKPEPEEAG